VPWAGDEEYTLPSGEKTTGIFHCPCHGSIFTANGQIIAGPAPRPMDLMELRIEDGKVVVDTGKIIQRERWDPKQAVKV
jgi:Rieske Fe-S protein